MIIFYAIHFVICLFFAIIFAKKKNFDHIFMALILSFAMTPILGIPFYRYMTP